MRTLERDTIDSLTRELAQTADELAYWRFQAVHFYCIVWLGRNTQYTDEQFDQAAKTLEKGYKEEHNAQE